MLSARYEHPFHSLNRSCVPPGPRDGLAAVCFPQEMGLGKTVEMLGCILANPYRSSVASGHSGNSEKENPQDRDRGGQGEGEVDTSTQTSKSGEAGSSKIIWVEVIVFSLSLGRHCRMIAPEDIVGALALVPLSRCWIGSRYRGTLGTPSNVTNGKKIGYDLFVV